MKYRTMAVILSIVPLAGAALACGGSFTTANSAKAGAQPAFVPSRRCCASN